MLAPGTHLSSAPSFHIREKISSIAANAVGIGQSRYRFTIANFYSVISDPFPPPLIDNNTATLRILRLRDPRFASIVEQEYIENSVLSGFALVGGIWTFLNGAFAIIFGSTLLLVLFGIKPLSVYGLLHTCRRNRGSLLLPHRPLDSREQQHIVRILREHLLDVDDLEANNATPTPGDDLTLAQNIVGVSKESDNLVVDSAGGDRSRTD